MFAVAVDGELITARAERVEVVKILKDTGREGKVEVASFEPSKGLWVAVCLENFGFAQAA